MPAPHVAGEDFERDLGGQAERVAAAHTAQAHALSIVENMGAKVAVRRS